MKTIKKIPLYVMTSIMFFIWNTQHVAAKDTASGSTNVSVIGTLIPPASCNINGGQDIDYDFGIVVMNDVKGEQYVKTKTISIQCDDAYPAQLEMQLKGTSLSEPHILNSGLPNMGVALFDSDSGSKVTLNDYFNINKDTNLSLKAVLVNTKPETNLKTGKFSASVTLEVRYK
jgi:type 1 fimbria pilin